MAEEPSPTRGAFPLEPEDVNPAYADASPSQQTSVIGTSSGPGGLNIPSGLDMRSDSHFIPHSVRESQRGRQRFRGSSVSRAPELSRKGSVKKGTGTPIKKRISRACDQCHQLRTKCDGKSPCGHCQGESNPLNLCRQPY